jgi:hypothetical protein
VLLTTSAVFRCLDWVFASLDDGERKVFTLILGGRGGLSQIIFMVKVVDNYRLVVYSVWV